MKHWIKRSLLGIVGATLLVGAASAWSHRGGAMGAPMTAEQQAQFKARMVERVSARLELSADQKTRLSALADALQAQRQAMMGPAGNPRADLQALVAGDKFDSARAQTLVNEKTAAITAQSPQVIAAMADFFDHLNPAQQAKVRQFMQSRHGMGHHGMERHG